MREASRTTLSVYTLAGLIFLAFLSGCTEQSRESRTGATTIRYSRWGLPEEIQAERELIAEFEKTHPDIKVVVEFASWAEYWNKLQAQMAAGTAPDVFLLNGGYSNDYAARGQLENLQPWVDADTSLTLDAYYPQTVAIFRDKNSLWALPRDCNTVAIYYNKTIFEKRKVPFPTPDWTWQDFLEKAKACTVDENGDGRTDIFGFNAGYDSMEVHWGYWIWQNNGEILSRDRTRCLLAEPPAVEALRFYSDLVVKHKVSPDVAQSSTFGSNMFLTGRLAMSAEGSWMIRTFREAQGFKWAIAPLPKGKRKAAPVNGLGNAMYSKSKNKKAAWQLLKFLASKPYQEKLAKSGTSIPALREVAESPLYLDDTVEGKRYFLDQLAYAQPLDFTRNFNKIEEAVRLELEAVWLGRKDIESAARDAAQAVDKILAENQKSNEKPQ
jgi:multiple sugar transport system substrate-binding protein